MARVVRGHVAVVVASLMAASGSAHAGLIGVKLFESPDIFSGFLDVTYDASTDLFQAQGFSLTFDDGGGAQPIANGSFSLSATVAPGGVFVGGSVTILGTVGLFGPTLLTGSLTAMGFLDPPGGDLFDFLFTVTGGDLASHYGGIGATAAIILDANDGSDFDGTFQNSFDNLVNGLPGTGQGVADTGLPVPSPAALGVLVLGALVSRRRRQA